MRNLRILNKGLLQPESRTYPDLPIVTAAFDVITDSVTVVLGCGDSEIVEVQQYVKDGTIRLLASFPVKSGDTLTSFAHFSDLTELIFVFESGDIITANYADNINGNDIDLTIVEVVGSIDVGILCSAWSPDEETLALLTKERNVVLLSRTFDPIAEIKQDSEDLEMTTQVSLGWGKKETQFRGTGARKSEARQRLALKHAGLNIDSDTAVLHDPTVKEMEYGIMTEHDHRDSASISWRGDCKYFGVNDVDISPKEDHTRRRVVRVYTRDGKLVSSSEPIDGLEGDNLSWKPQGANLACTQRVKEADPDDGSIHEHLNVVFLEKNGLRHGEFDTRIPEGQVINQIVWSSGSEALALRYNDRVQIWTTKNYHWYLKQEIFPADSHVQSSVSFVKFHPEKPFRLMVGTQTGVTIIDMDYCLTNGPTAAPYDIGMMLVADGTTCMMTPLAKAHVPPPISFREVEVGEPIIDMAASQSNENIAIVTNENLYIAHVSFAGKVVSSIEIVSHVSKDLFCIKGQPRQICFSGNDKVCVVCDTFAPSSCQLSEFDISSLEEPKLMTTTPTSISVVCLKSDSRFKNFSYETVDGSVYLGEGPKFIGKFPHFCSNYEVCELVKDGESNYVCFGITTNGKLFIGQRLLCSGATSILLSDKYLLYTTAQHELKFMHLENNDSLLDDTKPFELPVDIQSFDQQQENNNSVYGSEQEQMQYQQQNQVYDERARMIERGSWLISAIPSQSSVTLQAPRGNIETIFPRIMVLSEVRSAIKKRKYRKAFTICRTHRISLDILHDYDSELFFKNVEHFVNELGSVEYLDLFLSCLSEENVSETKYKQTSAEDAEAKSKMNTELGSELASLSIDDRQSSCKNGSALKGPEKVRTICDSVAKVLARPKYRAKYIQSIITACACQNPPKSKEALQLISAIENESEKERCVQHLCFLLDVNKLYDTALSIYDIPLALVLAQQSQKDPKEYLPFLQDLYKQEPNRKKFMVDTYLKKFDKALEWLIEDQKVKSSDSLDKEISEYILDHMLYKHALKLYRYDNKRFDDVLESYANYLHSSEKYSEAALAFDKLGNYEYALDDYISADSWKEALSIAVRPEFKDRLEDISEQLVENLKNIHKYSAAAYIENKYLGDLKEALRLYCKDCDFEEAILMCFDHGSNSEEEAEKLLKQIVDPALGEQFGIIAELLAECSSQSKAQLKRLRELRQKKQLNPFAFYNGNAENAENADNVSIAPTESTLRSSIFTRYTGKSSSTAKTGSSRRTAKNRRREERKRARGKKGTIYEEEYLIRSTGRLVDRLNLTVSDAEKLVEGLVRRGMMEQAHKIQADFIELQEFIENHMKEIYTMSDKDRERIDDRGIVYMIPEIPAPSMKKFTSREILEY